MVLMVLDFSSARDNLRVRIFLGDKIYSEKIGRKGLLIKEEDISHISEACSYLVIEYPIRLV